MKSHPALLLILVVLVAGLETSACATTFEEFGRMDNDDEAGFIAFEVQASADYLRAHGRADEADKAVALFHEPGPEGGVAKLAGNLKSMFLSNRRSDSLARNFDTTPFLVEDAISLTLRGAGMVVPAPVLVKAGDGFRPSDAPRHHLGVAEP